jgi:hypothetical protein
MDLKDHTKNSNQKKDARETTKRQPFRDQLDWCQRSETRWDWQSCMGLIHVFSWPGNLFIHHQYLDT